MFFRGKAIIPEDDRFSSLTGASTAHIQEICQALVNWGPRAEIEAPSLRSPSASLDKFARLITGSTASLLGYWYKFTKMAEALDKKDASIGERDQRISRLEEDLTQASKEKRKSDEELQAARLEIDRLRGKAPDLEARGYDRFQGHLRKALPHFDPATNWSSEFGGLLD